jgi:hypothetical protein
MTEIAERNRAIKKTLGQVFGRDKIRVRGSRGTGYGYVSVRIDHKPRDWQQARELESLCKALLRKTGIGLGRAYTDDTCQHATDQCHISFSRD